MSFRKFLFLLIATLTALPSQAGYIIYPLPHELTESDEWLTLSQSITLVCEVTDGCTIDDATRRRAEEVITEQGFSFQWADAPASEGTTLILSIDKALNEEANRHFDSHAIRMEGQQIRVTGQHTNAVYFGLATVEQLLEQRQGDKLKKVTINDWADEQIRGIVEGYYGYPYTIDTRIDLMEWGKRYKMNTFIYGPKGDPYHLGYWRRDYPTKVSTSEAANGMITQDDMRRLAEASKDTKVNLIWAAHPAFSDPIDLSTERGTMKGVDDILRKYDHLHSLGVRQFGIFLDDISVANGVRDCERHALLLRSVQDSLVKRYNYAGAEAADTVRPLQFVPTPYCFGFASEAEHKTYFKAIGTIQPEITVYYTGSGVWSNISEADFLKMKGYVGRPVAMWWNFPCNDNNDRNLYLLDVNSYYKTDAKLKSGLGIVCNPMAQGEASKVTLFGVMDYCWNVSAFRSKANWEHAFDACIADSAMAAAYKTFAPYAVESEPASLGTLISNYKKTPSERNHQALTAILDKLIEACSTLKELPATGRKDDALLWDDIHCWVDKLGDMCSLAEEFMRLRTVDDEEEQLCGLLALKDSYKALTKSKAYTVVQKEGAGTSTNTSSGIVTPSKKYLQPFIDWLTTNVIPLKAQDTHAAITSATLPSGVGIYSGSTKDLYDRNYGTLLWTNCHQKKDDCYTFTLKNETTVYGVRVVLAEADRMNAGTVELSTDKSKWTAAGTVKSNELKAIAGFDAFYKDITVKGKPARYVRFRLSDANTNKWFKMVDLEVTNVIKATDYKDEPVPALYDGDFFTSYTPTLRWINWNFNADAANAPRQLIIYQDTTRLVGADASRLPGVIISEDNGTTWSDTIPIAHAVSHIDLRSFEHPTNLRVVFDLSFRPEIYEIAESSDVWDGLTSPLPDEEHTTDAGRCYDLQGRPIEHPQAPGLYIQGHRKILIP